MRIINSGKDKAEVVDHRRPLDKTEMPQDGIKEKSNIVTDPGRTTVIDTQRIPRLSLMPNIRGSSWPVDYAHNLVGQNDVSRSIDWEVDNPSQQFEMVYGLELRVNSPLSRDQNTENNVFEIAGEATVMHSIVPNKNDTFFSDMGDGQYAVFNVTSVRRGSNSKIATYIITYVMRFEKRKEDIKRIKPVREYYFVKERLTYGADGLLTADEYNYYIARNKAISDIEDIYPRRFYDSECQTLRLPMPNKRVYYYDVFLTMFVKSLGIHVPGKDFVLYPHGNFIVRDMETVLKVLTDNSPAMLPYVERSFQPYMVRSFRNGLSYNNIAWSKFDGTIFPKEALTNDTACSCPSLVSGGVEFPDFDLGEAPYRGNEDEKLPWFITPSLDPYIFSKEFYEGGFASIMEYGLYLLLNRKPIQLDLGVKLFTECLKTPKLVQFYYLPMVYAVLKGSR